MTLSQHLIAAVRDFSFPCPPAWMKKKSFHKTEWQIFCIHRMRIIIATTNWQQLVWRVGKNAIAKNYIFTLFSQSKRSDQIHLSTFSIRQIKNRLKDNKCRLHNEWCVRVCGLFGKIFGMLHIRRHISNGKWEFDWIFGNRLTTAHGAFKSISINLNNQ